MANRLKETLKKNLQPYLFALKEGKKIRNDFLDYSLLLIHVQNNEIIKSPDHYNLIPSEPASLPRAISQKLS
jgi:hypothetical protein